MAIFHPRLSAASLSLLAFALYGCGEETPTPAATTVEPSSELRRVAFTRSGEDDAAPSVEVAGHIDPTEGVDTWEVVAPDWAFEESGTSKRPLSLTGQGTKLVTIPGPFSMDTFDRITVIVENSVNGSMGVRLKLASGQEIQVREEVSKGRYRHPITFKLPRAVEQGEIIESIALEVDVKRVVTIFGIDFVRQPMLTALPSPESGHALVNVGTMARRAVGIGPLQELKATWSEGARVSATVWIAGVTSQETWVDDDAMVHLELVPGQPVDGEESAAPVIREVQLLPSWTSVTFPGLAAGDYTLEATLTRADEGSAALISELALAGEPEENPRTVLLVTSDTHRADHLAITDQDADRSLETPNIDALAARGRLFTSAWTTSNTTIPSHSALLTGRHPRDTKVLGNYSKLGADPESSPRTLAEEFAKKGFTTVAVISSSHLQNEYSGLGRGFDVVIKPEGSESRAALSVQLALAQLRGGRPTFLWLHLFDAHGPYLPPGKFDRLYYPKDKNPFDPALPEIDLEGGRMPLWLRGLRDMEFPRGQYRGEIAYLDEQLGPLLNHPRVAGGITALTSDHGEVFARNGVFFEHKGLTPDTLHVPLIISAPWMGDGARVSTHVRQMDLGRTLLNLAGFNDVEFPGRDILSEASGEDEPSFAVSRRFASVTHGQWHAILTLSNIVQPKGGRWPARHQLELYDIEADPGCKNDLAGTNFDVEARYHKAILTWLAAEDPMMRASRPNLDRSARMNLAALGYGADDGPAEGTLYDSSCSCAQCLKFK